MADKFLGESLVSAGDSSDSESSANGSESAVERESKPEKRLLENIDDSQLPQPKKQKIFDTSIFCSVLVTNISRSTNESFFEDTAKSHKIDICDIRLFHCIQSDDPFILGYAYIDCNSYDDSQRLISVLNGLLNDRHYLHCQLRKIRTPKPVIDVTNDAKNSDDSDADNDRKMDTKEATSPIVKMTNLHWNVNRKKIEKFFTNEPMLHCRIYLNTTGFPIGVAAIGFKTPQIAQRVIAEYQNKVLNGRPVNLSVYKVNPNQSVFEQSYPELEGKTYTIVMHNIRHDCIEMDIEKLIKKKVKCDPTDIRLLHDRIDVKPGRAYVTFETTEMADKAVKKLNNTALKKKYVSVSWVRDQEEFAANKEVIGKTREIRILNIRWNVEIGDIQSFVGMVGSPELIDVPLTKSGFIKGFATVRFATAEFAKKAVHKLDGKKMLNRVVRVTFKVENTEDENWNNRNRHKSKMLSLQNAKALKSWWFVHQKS